MSDLFQPYRSDSMRAIADMVRKIAGTSATVLIRGETGVGKEIVARAIHDASPRARQPLVRVNCAALPEELLESELFGHERGAFTGAHRQKLGRFEAAQRGTLFLDEIGELPLTVQAKLLHVLQDGTFSRLGGIESLETEARLITATNRDLESAVSSGQFRSDLYYRLNAIELYVPPLRDRLDEIPALVQHFLRKFDTDPGQPLTVPDDTLKILLAYSWPGNVRELENVVRRAVVLGSFTAATAELSACVGHAQSAAAAPLGRTAFVTQEVAGGLKQIARRAARDAERIAIKEVLDRVQWNRAKAARLLQISYKALLYKITQCGLGTDVQEEQPAS